MKYIIIILISISILLINNINIINGGSLKNSLEYYNIKKYFKCAGEDLLDKINNISLTECLNKCINDINCTCLHYNLDKRICYYKKNTSDYKKNTSDYKKNTSDYKKNTSDYKSLISDKNYTSYIKKKNIRNLNNNYIFLTFVIPTQAQNTNLKIININQVDKTLQLSDNITKNDYYSFYIKDPNTNYIVTDILSIKPNTRYIIGYINLTNNNEEDSSYKISFYDIIKDKYNKLSIYHEYDIVPITFYDNTTSVDKIKFNQINNFKILKLNNLISDNVIISTNTHTTNIFNKSTYYIANHNFLIDKKLSIKNFKNKIFNKTKNNINAIWDFYFEKNNEGNPNFCNKKYSFDNNSITDKNCFINNIWKINYNDYNATYNFKSINSNFTSTDTTSYTDLKIDDNTNFYLTIDHIRIDEITGKLKIYFKITNLSSMYLYLHRENTHTDLLKKFCYHYIKYNNKEFIPPSSTSPINPNKNLVTEATVDDFNTCIDACDETTEAADDSNECIYLNFIVDPPNPNNSKYNKHAYIKTKVNNLKDIKCEYYSGPVNTNNTPIKNNRSIYLKKEKYNCSDCSKKPIQDLVFMTKNYYNNASEDNYDALSSDEIILWNIEISNPTYKKYVNKKNSLNKISPPKLKPNLYWTNTKKYIGELGLGLSCKNYKELDLDVNSIENECSTNNCNYNILKELCDNNPLCTNFQISKDQTECYLSNLNNVDLLKDDINSNSDKLITTYYKN